MHSFSLAFVDLSAGGAGLAAGLGGGFALGAARAGARAGAFLAGSDSSATLAVGILTRPRPLLRSDKAEGGGAAMNRTCFLGEALAFLMVFLGGAAFFCGGGCVVFKAKMGLGEAGFAGGGAAFFAGGLAAGFFAGAFFATAAFFAAAAFAGCLFFGAGLPMRLLRNSVAEWVDSMESRGEVVFFSEGPKRNGIGEGGKKRKVCGKLWFGTCSGDTSCIATDDCATNRHARLALQVLHALAERGATLWSWWFGARCGTCG